MSSDQKQWAQSPSIEKTRAYRRHDLDLHAKISIWEIIRFEPGWVPKPEINVGSISAVIFFCQFATLFWTPESPHQCDFAKASRAHAQANQSICDAFHGYNIVESWKTIWQFCSKIDDDRRGSMSSDQKQRGQSPSIEKTRAYRRHDLDLHTKISIWEIRNNPLRTWMGPEA